MSAAPTTEVKPAPPAIEKIKVKVDGREIEVPRTGDRKSDALALTTTVFAIFEGWVREQPEQWMWWNTRWIEAADPATAESGADEGRVD